MFKRVKKCHICESKELEPFDKVKDLPCLDVAMTSVEENSFFLDMALVQCKRCHTMMLSSFPAAEILYSQKNQRHDSDLWKGHHELFFGFLKDSVTFATSFLEIGASDFSMHGYIDEGFSVDEYVVVEPSGSRLNSNVTTINDLFPTKSLGSEKKFDVILHSHCLEHALNPDEFIKGCVDLMHSDSRLIFSIPDLIFNIDNLHPNSIDFEHWWLITKQHVEFLCNKNGLEIDHTISVRSYPSLFFSFKKISKNIEKRQTKLLQFDGGPKVRDYLTALRTDVEVINSKIKELYSSQSVYFYGAYFGYHIYNSLGLSEHQFSGLLDSSKAKHGKILYGTKLNIYSPEAVLKDGDVIVVRVGHFNGEVEQYLSSLGLELELI